MFAVLSPAKTFARRTTPPGNAASAEPTRPHFAADAARLAKAAAKLDADDLRRLMGISPALAELNVERYARFAQADARPAIAAFDGDVYRGFDAATLDGEALDHAAANVRMLSGLYGLLRPTDAIRDHRMEMGTGWAPAGGDLYGHWKARVARRLEAELAASGGRTILNLASKEYWRVVAPHLRRRARVVTVDFRDAGPDGGRFNSFVAKKARGAMARMMCELRATDPEQLTGFDHAGYAYAGTDAGADGDVMRFVR